MLKQKLEDLIRENHVTQLTKDTTEIFKKQIQQTLQKWNVLIDKKQQKFLSQMKPAPKLSALTKTHVHDEPIRPAINNIHASSCKLTKYLNKQLNQLIQLPHTYATKRSNEVTHDLHNISITDHHQIITLDIKDLHVNLHIKHDQQYQTVAK